MTISAIKKDITEASSEAIMNVPFYVHQLTPDDGDAIKNILATPFITSGQIGRQVEEQLAAYFGVPHALLVNSWTNGAFATLLALDIKPGDEVIVPAMTFIASANVVEMAGAKPVFVDVDPDTLLISLEGVKKAITPKSKAVIPVHLYGQMMDVAALRQIVGDKIAILEDCAHCFEGEFNGHKPGTYSDAAIFSFYATKNVTCGEGGAIIARSDELAARLKQTRMHGMSAGAIDRFRGGGYRHWDMQRLGVKANLPDLLSALLPPQISSIDARLPQREAVAHRYQAALIKSNLLRVPKIMEGVKHARHLFPVHISGGMRDRALEKLSAAGVNCTVNYRSVPTLTYYREKYGYTPQDFPVSYAWGEGTFTLPLYPQIPADQQDYVIDKLLGIADP